MYLKIPAIPVTNHAVGLIRLPVQLSKKYEIDQNFMHTALEKLIFLPQGTGMSTENGWDNYRLNTGGKSINLVSDDFC